MQYYLDTNIILFSLTSDSEISNDVREILNDYSNVLYTSSVCVMEAVHILQTKPLNKKMQDPTRIFEYLDFMGVNIKYVTKSHIDKFIEMPVLHTDPNDRLIIAQAISDKITLISSDTKFPLYAKALKDFKFVLNKR